jgi:Acetyltransferase (GNAT) family.
MRDVYEGQFGPYTTKVEVRTVRAGTRIGKNGREIPIDPFIEIRGKIFSPEGYEIGDFTRSIQPLEIRQLDGTTRREMWAHHDVVQIDPKYQGKGFGTAFNRRAIDWYRESGLHGIYLDDHNFYVWASQGFNFTGGLMPAYKAEELRDLIGRLRTGAAENQYREAIPKPLGEAKDLEAQIAAAEDLLRRYETLQPGQPGYPTAYEVSQLGRNGRKGKSATWIGKFLGIQAEEMVLNPAEGIIVSR